MVTRQLEIANDKLTNPTLINTIKQRIGAIEYVQWRAAIDKQMAHEQQQLTELMNEWKTIHARWVLIKREQLAVAKQSMEASLDFHNLKHKLKELEFSLVQQYRRVSYVNGVLS